MTGTARAHLFLLCTAVLLLSACSDHESTGDASSTHGGTSHGTGGGGTTTTSGNGGTANLAPAAPSNLMVGVLGLGLHVTWADEADNEDDFVVERHDGSGSFAEVAMLPFDSDQYHDEGGLTSGTMYTYRVGAVNAVGTSYSAEAMGTAP